MQPTCTMCIVHWQICNVLCTRASSCQAATVPVATFQFSCRITDYFVYSITDYFVQYYGLFRLVSRTISCSTSESPLHFISCLTVWTMGAIFPFFSLPFCTYIFISVLFNSNQRTVCKSVSWEVSGENNYYLPGTFWWKRRTAIEITLKCEFSLVPSLLSLKIS